MNGQSLVVGVSKNKVSGLAITALVLGIVGVFCSWAFAWMIPLNFVLGIAALVIGIIAFKKISAGISSLKGRGIALVGIILGSVTIIVAIIYLILVLTWGVAHPGQDIGFFNI